MNNLIYILVFIVTIQSCDNTASKKQALNPKSKQSLPLKNNLVKYKIQGKRELTLFEKRYENNCNVKPEKFPYSNGNSVKVFELNCQFECFRSEFNNRVSRGIEISKEDFLSLTELLNNPNSYKKPTAACYYPKFGLVVYDSLGIPTESMSICLDCNNFDTYPGKITVNRSKLGFSKEARKKLRQMFFKWGIDYYGFSSFWDDEQDYKNYLEKKNK